MLSQFRRAGIAFFALAGIMIFSVAAVAATSYYVSTSGNDANYGTITAPWRTVQHAANAATPGSTVYVRGGTYNERVNVNVSGTATGGYITFTSYPGELATLDGAGIVVPATNNGMFYIQNQNYIIIQGFQIQNYQSSKLNIVPAGIRIQGACSYIQLLGNIVHDIKTLVKNRNGGDAFGIVAYGDSAPASINNLIIDSNQVYSLKTGSSETVVVNGNVDTFFITRNIIHDNDNIGIDAIGFEGTSPDPNYDQARNGQISGNIVYNITSKGNPAYGSDQSANGIYVDGGTLITIERNVIHNVDIGIEMASEHAGRKTSFVTARSNLVYSSHVVGLSIGGYASNVGGTDHCVIVNNTLYDNDTTRSGSGELQIQYDATNNTFSNNVLYANSQGVLITSPFHPVKSPTVAMDYNVYYSSAGPNNSSWQWNVTNYAGFSAYTKHTGNDVHSFFADPQYISTVTPDFHLQLTSPAVNAGINLGPTVVGTLDLDGKPRVKSLSIDMGCYEQ